MRRLGIAIVVQNIDATGGMERQAFQLADRLARRGARVWIISTVQVAGFVPHLPAGIRGVEYRGRLTIHRVPLCVGWRWATCLSFYELAIAWILATRAHALDAIYAVHWTTALSAAPAARFLDCPLYVKFACGGEYGDLATIDRTPERGATLARLTSAERFVCISPQIALEASAAGLPPDRFLSIPNGVDRGRFAHLCPARLPGPEGAEHVVVVAALRREKRIPELVRAFSSVAHSRPLAHLIIAGEGPEEPAIRAAAREAGLEERIHLLGNRADVPEVLAAADVLVMASAAEGLSNVLLEGLSAGTPIVATDIEGNRAVVGHEKEALLVPLGDSEALGAAIIRLLEDRALAARLSLAARARAERYDFAAVTRLYEQAFRETLRSRTSALRLAWRYPGRFESAGVLGLSWTFIRFLASKTRTRLTHMVIWVKRVLGIERKIWTWPRGSSRGDRHPERSRARI
jgi:glycosyltransferase involved in cell wall biosynthesis